MESSNIPLDLTPKLRATFHTMTQAMHTFFSQTAEMVSTVVGMWSRGLQPKVSTPAVHRKELGRMRAGLEDLDERELKAEQVEAEFREKMATLPGDFISRAAPIIDES